jgi:muramoyltetrapeptide carboxypeptidase
MNNYMNRRTALTTSLAAAAGTFVFTSEGTAAQPRKSMNKPSAATVLKPKALQAGMKLGMAFPAGWTTMADVEKGKAYLEGLGFVVELGSNAGKTHGYLSAPDKDRANEFMRFIERKDIDGIICARGGYGIMRMLQYLDFASIRRNCKVICGYSDITALINSIHQHSGIVTFHGPGALAAWDEFTFKHFAPVAFAPEFAATFATALQAPVRNAKDQSFSLTPPKTSDFTPPTTITPGKTAGKLVGGNLTLLANTMGTPYEIDTNRAILFFEDVTEEPYRIDRMITQLLIAGKLQRAAGLALGQFTKCEASDPDHSFTVPDLLRERLQDLNIPTVTGLQFGHVASKHTYPVGIQAELDATTGVLKLLERAVV